MTQDDLLNNPPVIFRINYSVYVILLIFSQLSISFPRDLPVLLLYGLSLAISYLPQKTLFEEAMTVIVATLAVILACVRLYMIKTTSVEEMIREALRRIIKNPIKEQ